MTEIAFGAALLLLAYIYVGYPVLVALLARLFPRSVRRGPHEPRIALVIVAYNEAARIGRKLDSCLALDYPKERMRIVVASDGSSDETAAVVAAYADRGVTLLAYPERRGKAACVADTVGRCEEQIVVLTDARQRLDARAVRELVENLADPDVGAVSGELEFEAEGMTGFGEGVDAYWRYEKFIRRHESLFHSAVGVTGALYAIRRECFRPIPADTILDDVVIPMNVVMAGKRVVFEGRAKAFDLPSRDARQERLRKVRTIAGNWQLMTAHPRFFVPLRNPIFLQLVSHKVLRLVAPFALAVLLVTNIVLATQGPAYQALLALQLAGYALPAVGWAWPMAGRWKVVRVATAFLALNAFAVLGMLEFFRNRSAHLWHPGPR